MWNIKNKGIEAHKEVKWPCISFNIVSAKRGTG